jgi:D-alanyl-D-alanine carboxypeptidase (penicillin-binding protein 5/6)
VKQVVEGGARWITRRLILAVAIFCLASVADFATANATKRAPHRHKVAHAKKGVATAPAHTYENGRLYKGALLEDADTGRVLLAYNADMEWPPASMAKMMNLLVAQEQISQGRFNPNDMVRISERAAHTGGSRVGLKEGDLYPLRELMKAALVKSANDAAVAVAEKIAGSVEGMVRLMNQRARELGMMHTEYQTVDGLPPRPTHDADRTTAYDLATVARAIIRETNLLEWSGQESVDFDGGVCMLHNTNHLVGHFEGCDGLKTGFTYQAGFNVTTTAKRGNMRIIAVILGAPSNAQRFVQAAKLMDWGFQNYTAVALLKAGEALPVQVQVRSGPAFRPVASSDLKVVMRKSDVSTVKLVYDVPPMVDGPLKPGDALGKVVVHSQGTVITEASAICPIAIDAPRAQVISEGYNPDAPPAQ